MQGRMFQYYYITACVIYEIICIDDHFFRREFYDNDKMINRIRQFANSEIVPSKPLVILFFIHNNDEAYCILKLNKTEEQTCLYLV